MNIPRHSKKDFLILRFKWVKHNSHNETEIIKRECIYTDYFHVKDEWWKEKPKIKKVSEAKRKRRIERGYIRKENRA